MFKNYIGDTSMMKKNGIFTKFIWLMISSFLASFFWINSSMATTDKIVAVVNNDIVMQSEVQKKVDILKKQMANDRSGKIRSDAELRKQVLDTIIDRDLQLQLAKKAGLDVTSAEVDKAMENIAKRGGVNVATMQQELKSQGIVLKDFRNEIKQSMIINRLQQQTLGRGLSVTDQEAQAFLKKASKAMAQNVRPVEKKQYHLLNIFIPIPDNATEQDKSYAEGKATLLVDKLQEGADYNQLLFEDKSIRGQDLGWRTISQMPEVFATQVLKMKPGDAAGAINAPNGYHIIKLVEIRENDHASNVPATPKLTLIDAKEMVYRQKLEEKANKWIKDLRSSAYIKITDGDE